MFKIRFYQRSGQHKTHWFYIRRYIINLLRKTILLGTLIGELSSYTYLLIGGNKLATNIVYYSQNKCIDSNVINKNVS